MFSLQEASESIFPAQLPEIEIASIMNASHLFKEQFIPIIPSELAGKMGPIGII